MNAGHFNKRIDFLMKNDEGAVNENGFPTEDFGVIKSVWAMIKTVSTREYYQAMSEQNEVTTRFIIRYISGLNEDMQIRYKNQIFNINSIINDNEKNETLTIMAVQVR
ncbi:phage head closure protein [Priestia koreensis]|uniref:phage head closure protein n=1 Tax=Priestia koreensis TaxID=284581 RepID=UPI003D0628F7